MSSPDQDVKLSAEGDICEQSLSPDSLTPAPDHPPPAIVISDLSTSPIVTGSPQQNVNKQLSCVYSSTGRGKRGKSKADRSKSGSSSKRKLAQTDFCGNALLGPVVKTRTPRKISDFWPKVRSSTNILPGISNFEFRPRLTFSSGAGHLPLSIMADQVVQPSPSDTNSPKPPSNIDDVLALLHNMEINNAARNDELKEEMSKNKLAMKKDIQAVTDKLENFQREVSVADSKTAERIASLEAEVATCKAELQAHKFPPELTNRITTIEDGFKQLKATSATAQNSQGDAALFKTIESLKRNIEFQERQLKKKNIIIRGWAPQSQSSSIQKEVDAFLCANLGISENPSEEVIQLSRDKKVLVKLRNFKDKLEIFKNKRQVLGPQKIFIDGDLTFLERSIQTKLMGLACAERRKGLKAAVFGNKIDLQGVQWLWDERADKLRPLNDAAKLNAASGLIPHFPEESSEERGPPGGGNR